MNQWPGFLNFSDQQRNSRKWSCTALKIAHSIILRDESSRVLARVGMDQSGQVQRITVADTFVHSSGNNNTPHQTTNVCPAATSYNNIPLHLSLVRWRTCLSVSPLYLSIWGEQQAVRVSRVYRLSILRMVLPARPCGQQFRPTEEEDMQMVCRSVLIERRGILTFTYCVRVNSSEHISGISFVLNYCIPSTFPVSTLGRSNNEEEAFIGLMYAQIP